MLKDTGWRNGLANIEWRVERETQLSRANEGNERKSTRGSETWCLSNKESESVRDKAAVSEQRETQ